jgi:hypothetical protein
MGWLSGTSGVDAKPATEEESSEINSRRSKDLIGVVFTSSHWQIADCRNASIPKRERNGMPLLPPENARASSG